MVQVKGSDVASGAASSLAPKCEKHIKPLKKKKKIDLQATGDPKTNLLLEFLLCQSKATKSCQDERKQYDLCHKSFMGVGSYKGKNHCGNQMAALLGCIKTSSKE